MQLSPSVRLWADDTQVAAPKIVLFKLVRGREPGDSLRRAIARARQSLLARQQPDGSFAVPRPLGPPSLAALMLSTAYLENHDPTRLKIAARALLDAQRADGGWSDEAGSQLDLNVSVLAYFALKLAGQSPASEPMVCARRAILSRGGATNIDDAAKTWLALFDQLPYDCVSVRSDDHTAHCGRVIVMTLQPRRHIGSRYGIRELVLQSPKSKSRLGGALGRIFGKQRRRMIQNLRHRLLEQLNHWQATPPSGFHAPEELAWTLVALDALGMTADTPARRQAASVLSAVADTDTETPVLKSPPVASATAASMVAALRDSGLDENHAGLREALAALTRKVGTRTVDVAQVLLSLSIVQPKKADILPPPLQVWADEETTESTASLNESFVAPDHLARRLVNAQNSDGAWPSDLHASRRHCQSDLCATAWAMLALASVRKSEITPRLAQAIAWLRTCQQPDGSWQDCTGAVATTSLVLRALTAADVADDDPTVMAGAQWLLAHQQSDGGWGDMTPAQPDALAGEGAPSPCHTATALLGLIAAGEGGSEAAARGADYLLATQSDEGDWAASRTSHSSSLDAALLAIAEPLRALGQYAARPRSVQVAPETVLRVASFAPEA